MPSAEGSNMHAHRMQPPKDDQPAITLLLAVKTLFTNLKTFVTSFCFVFGNKNRVGVVALFFFFNVFPVATFVCFASFFSTGGSGRQTILEKSGRWEFVLKLMKYMSECMSTA